MHYINKILEKKELSIDLIIFYYGVDRNFYSVFDGLFDWMGY